MRLYIITFIFILLLAVNISSSLFQLSNFTYACTRFTFSELLKNPPVNYNKNELLQNPEPDTLKTTGSGNSGDCSETPNDSTVTEYPSVKEQKVSVPIIFVGSNGQIYIISSKDSIP